MCVCVYLCIRVADFILEHFNAKNAHFHLNILPVPWSPLEQPPPPPPFHPSPLPPIAAFVRRQRRQLQLEKKKLESQCYSLSIRSIEYGVASTGRLPKLLDLFCKRALLLQKSPAFVKEPYSCKKAQILQKRTAFVRLISRDFRFNAFRRF